MNILIAGGTGFIGSYLCKFLLEKDNKIICIDNLITSNTQNISHLLTTQHPKFKFIPKDIVEPLDLRIGIIDYILHFASPASPVDYIRFPIQTLKTGALGTYNLLELAKIYKAKLLLASTSEVYGDPLVNPQPESYWGNVNPIGERSCYDEAKRFAEALTMAYHREHKIDTKILRIFNCYGPGLRHNDGRIMSNYITRALKNEPLRVHGDGNQTRSFCYISDLVDGIYKLMMSNINEPVNIGNPDEISVIDLANKVIELVGSNSKIVFIPFPTNDDPKVRKPDISKAKKELKWKPKINLEEGLNATISWFRKGEL